MSSQTEISTGSANISSNGERKGNKRDFQNYSVANKGLSAVRPCRPKFPCGLPGLLVGGADEYRRLATGAPILSATRLPASFRAVRHLPTDDRCHHLSR